MTSLDRPNPVIDDPDTGGFFAAAGEGRLVVRSCQQCGRALHLPRSYCHLCDSFDVEWRTVSGSASLYSWTVTEREISPAFPVPYTVVVVALDDEPNVHLIGDLPGRPSLHAGMPMRVRFDRLPSGAVLPQWEPAEQPAS